MSNVAVVNADEKPNDNASVRKLEEIAQGLSPKAQKIFRAAAIHFSDIGKKHDPITHTHKKLEHMADGHIYYNLARELLHELEKELVFTQPIPYPVISNRIGLEDQELAFLDGGPKIVMAFPFREGSGGAIEVDYSWGRSDYIHPSKLSKRMYDEMINVEDLESFHEFLGKGVKGFREANPFKRNTTVPQEGDLVYCVMYPDCKWMMGPNQLMGLGNVLDPNNRLGRIEEITEEEGVRNYFLTTLSGQKKFNYIHHEEPFDLEKRKDRSGRGMIDEVHVIRPAGWTEAELQRPFMTNEEVEQIVIPQIMKYGEDPRKYSAHMKKCQLLNQQFGNMLKAGASPDKIVNIFTDDYGMKPRQVFALAGGSRDDLKQLVKPKLEKIIAEFSEHGDEASVMIAQTAKIMGMTEEELIAPIESKTGMIEDDLCMMYFGRKVRANNFRGEQVIGYVSTIRDYSTKEEPDQVGVNVYHDMTNPNAQESIDYHTIQVLGLDEYRNSANLFELERINHFLKNQVACLSLENRNLDDKVTEVGEYLEDKLVELKTAEQQREEKKRGHRAKNERDDTPSSNYDRMKNDVDKNVTGPLLSYGFNEEETRAYVMQESGGHPMMVKVLDDIFGYRNRKKENPFKTNRLARRMLDAVVESGESDYNEVIRIIDSFMADPEFNGNEESYMLASNLIIAETLSNKGDGFAPLTEMLEEEKTGKKKEYLESWQVSEIVGRFIEAGEPTPKALEGVGDRRRRRSQANIGRVYIEQDPRSADSMYLRITNTDIALDMCALMLLDEIATMNKDDPRNAEYRAQEGFMTIENRIKNLSGLARLFPLSDSNYYLKADVHQDSYHDPDRNIYIRTGNLQPQEFQAHFDRKPSVAKQVKLMKDKGMPVKLDGNHILKKDSEGGYIIIPEWEISTPTNNEILLFNVGKHDSDYRSHNRTSKRLRRMERYEDGMHIEFSYSHISAHHCRYLGSDRATQLLESVGKKIEKHFELQSDKLMQYATGIERRALPQAPILMIAKGNDK